MGSISLELTISTGKWCIIFCKQAPKRKTDIFLIKFLRILRKWYINMSFISKTSLRLIKYRSYKNFWWKWRIHLGWIKINIFVRIFCCHLKSCVWLFHLHLALGFCLNSKKVDFLVLLNVTGIWCGILSQSNISATSKFAINSMFVFMPFLKKNYKHPYLMSNWKMLLQNMKGKSP